MQPGELQGLAARTVPGDGAMEFRRLGGGLVNESYQVRRGGHLYVLRVAAANPEELGLDRQWESRVLESAMAAGLAPVIEFSDPLAGILVLRWVPGRSWTAQEVQAHANLEKVAHLTRQIQALPVPSPARHMNPAAWIGFYRHALARCGGDSGRQRFAMQAHEDGLLAALARFPTVTPVLCHGDLHSMNLVDSDRALVALDWEYSHMSDPLWDLAGWSSNNDLEHEHQRDLLASYLGRRPAPQERSRLRVLATLYDCICLLWSEIYLNQRPNANRGPDGASEAVAARMDLLKARLSAPGSRAGQVPAH
jgi:thiamine kinase-like enzyme